MADAAERASERAWRGPGEAGDLARLVVARVRSGALPAAAAALAERLATGAASVEDVLLAGLAGHPWARPLAAEVLAERAAYAAADRALDAALGDGPLTPDALEDWLVVAADLGPPALGLAAAAVVARLRQELATLPAALASDGDYADFFVEVHERDRRFALGDLDATRAAVEAYAATGDRAAAAALHDAIGRGLGRYLGHAFDRAPRAAALAATLLLARSPGDRRRAARDLARELDGLLAPAAVVAAVRAGVAPRLGDAAPPPGAASAPGGDAAPGAAVTVTVTPARS